MNSSVLNFRRTNEVFSKCQLGDFLDSSSSESEDSFACDEGVESGESAEDEEAKSMEACFKDNTKRNGLVGMMRQSFAMARQSSRRSIFSNGSGYQQELESIHSDSDSEDSSHHKDRDDGDSEEGKKNGRRSMLVKQASFNVIFGKSGNGRQNIGSEERSGGEVISLGYASGRNNGRGADKERARKSPAIVGHFRRNMPMSKQSSIRNLFGMNNSTHQELGSDGSDTETGHDESKEENYPGNEGKTENRSKLDRRVLLSKKNECESKSLKLDSENYSPFSNFGNLMAAPQHSPKVSDEQYGKAKAERHDATGRRKEYSDVDHQKSDLSRIDAMASGMILNGVRSLKRSEGSGGRRQRKRISRSRSDPGDIATMFESQSYGKSEEGACMQAPDEIGRPRSKSLRDEDLETSKFYHQRRNICDRSLTSQLSDLSLEFGELRSVPEQDLVEDEEEYEQVAHKVPSSITCSFEMNKSVCSQGTNTTELDMSEAQEVEVVEHVWDSRESLHSKSSKRSRHRGRGREYKESRPPSRSRQTSLERAVRLPGSAEKTADESISRSYHRRKGEASTRQKLCSFQIDDRRPLVRSKSVGSAEFVELNISWHDGSNSASLVRAKV